VVLAIVTWIAANTVALRLGFHPIEPPPFAWLTCWATLTALLATVIILTTQHRQERLTQERAHLDLQVNMVAEEKIAKLIFLVEELRRDLPMVRDRRDSLADAMTEALDVQAVVGEIEATKPRKGE
jgi:uncharacterized membrane protein